MSFPNFPFGSVQVTPVVTGDFYAPNHASIGVSDYFAVATSASAIRFTRPISDGQGFEFTNPGARVRFTTNASRIDVVLNYTNLVTRLDTYNGVGAIYANGVLVDTFNHGQGAAATQIATHVFGSSASRLIEVVMPYCASVDYAGVYVTPGATFTAPAARPTSVLVAAGDSITHGFLGSTDALGWVRGVSTALGVQQKNQGYGGRVAVATDGTKAGDAAAAFGASARITYMIGVNDCIAGVALATFKTAAGTFVTNARAAAPSAKIILLTPFYCQSIEALNTGVYPSQIATIGDYRGKMAEVKAASADGNLFLVNGLAVMTNSSTRLASDLIHPNDVGLAEVTANLPALL